MKKELNPFTIGVDESNMGRWPRVYVAVGSRYINDLVERNLEKERPINRSIGQILHGRPYWHMLINQQHLKNAGSEEGLKYFVLRSFVDAFQRYDDPKRKVSRVLLDGMLAEKVQEFFVEDYPGIELIVQPAADETWPLVNKSDSIASLLRTVYCQSRNNNHEPSKYVDRLIPFSQYAERLKEIAKHK